MIGGGATSFWGTCPGACGGHPDAPHPDRVNRSRGRTRQVYICFLYARVRSVASADPSWNVPNHLSNGISEVP